MFYRDTTSPRPTKPLGFSPALVLTVAVVVVGIALAGYFAMFAERGGGRRAQCMHQLRTIGFALDMYKETHGTYPPAYVADENGRPMHSWRVLILPFFGDAELTAIYEQYDFDEPWDGPNNMRLAKEVPFVYDCPANSDVAGQPHYVAVVGDETMWPGSEPVGRFANTDSPGGTILVVETDRFNGSWLEPRDLTFDEAAQGINPPSGPGFASQHSGGACAAFAGGNVQFLDDSLSPDVVRALLTRSGGEDVDPQAL